MSQVILSDLHKSCNKCNESKLLANFQFVNYPRRDRRHDECRQCRKKEQLAHKQKTWKENNREAYRERRKRLNQHSQIRASTRRRQKAKRKRIVAWYKEYKSSLKCAMCPEAHPACLDFHHRDPTSKVKDVARMVRDRYGKDRILAEIAKCDVLCQNCHRIEEAQRNSARPPLTDRKENRHITKRYAWYRSQKIGKQCACSERRPECLDFHHRSGEHKVDDVSMLVGRMRPISVVLEEIKKCDILCGNCHRKLHYENDE